MIDFDSCDQFAKFLDVTVKRRLAQVPALEIAAQIVEHAAKEEIGHYQRSNLGPFEPWAELTDSTKEGRVKKGYTENDPLLRDGTLRDSITHHTDISGNEAVIGSSLDKMVYLELGTKYMRPRSVLGLAAYRSRKRIVRIVGGVTVAALLNVDFREAGSWVFSHQEKED